MSTRRIENLRYGMVVTDGVAQRVFMLVQRQWPEAEFTDSLLVWWAMRIGMDGTVGKDMIYLAPGEWAEVIP